jgi:hypothetical protein
MVRERMTWVNADDIDPQPKSATLCRRACRRAPQPLWSCAGLSARAVKRSCTGSVTLRHIEQRAQDLSEATLFSRRDSDARDIIAQPPW